MSIEFIASVLQYMHMYTIALNYTYVAVLLLMYLYGALFLQSPDGKLVASGAIDGIINLFDLQSGRLLHTLEGGPLRACKYIKGLRYHLRYNAILEHYFSLAPT